MSCPVLSVTLVGVLWPNGWMDQDATWYGGIESAVFLNDPAADDADNEEDDDEC